MSHHPTQAKCSIFLCSAFSTTRISNTNESWVAPIDHSRCWKDLKSIDSHPKWKDKSKPSPQTEGGPEWRDTPETELTSRPEWRDVPEVKPTGSPEWRDVPKPNWTVILSEGVDHNQTKPNQTCPEWRDKPQPPMMIPTRPRRVSTRSPALAVLPLAWPFVATPFSSSKLLPSLSSMQISFLSTYGTCGDDTAKGGVLEYSTGTHLVSRISQTFICN